ncbi:MAG: acyl-CoA thioesterase [Thermoanaerobaculia bacterium]
MRYSETDRMGIVYHAHYIVWFEIGRTEFCRAGGLPYRALEDGGLFILVTGVECAYRQPARYDDPIRIATALSVLSRRGMEFLYEVQGENGRLANGVSRHVFAGADGRPVRAPRDVIERLDRFRKPAGES